MNVYDFDETIYDGDSTRDFVLFCMKKHKKAMMYIPIIGYYSLKYYLFHIGTKTQFKEKMYGFLKYTNGESDVEGFWKEKLRNIKQFYKKQHKDDDIIISASPEFLLKPLEKALNITVIASKVDIKSGKYRGENCYWDEKVKRFSEIYPSGNIESFYSDSYSDEPLAKLAKRAYIVKDNEITDWDFTKHKKRLRV